MGHLDYWKLLETPGTELELVYITRVSHVQIKKAITFVRKKTSNNLLHEFFAKLLQYPGAEKMASFFKEKSCASGLIRQHL